MAKTPSPLHTKRIPKSVSKPTLTAEAAATVAEAALVAPTKKVRLAVKKIAAETKNAPRVAAKKTKPELVALSLESEAPAKAPKAHKTKLVRDSFTIPKDEYQVLDALKGRALALGQHVRKSELLRAGIQALAAMNDRAFLMAIGAVPTLKTGRPKIE